MFEALVPQTAVVGNVRTFRVVSVTFAEHSVLVFHEVIADGSVIAIHFADAVVRDVVGHNSFESEADVAVCVNFVIRSGKIDRVTLNFRSVNLRHVFDEDFCRFVVNVAAVCGFRALHNVFARHIFDEIDCLHIFAVGGFGVCKLNEIAAGCGRSVVGENVSSVCVRLVAGEFDFFDVSFSDDVIEINRALQAVNHGAGVVGQLFHVFQRHGKDACGRRAETFCRYAIEQVSVFEHVVALRFQSFGVFAGFQIDVRRTIGNVSNLNFRRLARNGFQAVADKIAAFKVDDFNGFDAREHAVFVSVLCAARAVQAVVDGHFPVACA